MLLENVSHILSEDLKDVMDFLIQELVVVKTLSSCVLASFEMEGSDQALSRHQVGDSFRT